MSDYYPNFPEETLTQLSLMVQLQKEDDTYILGGGYGIEVEELFLALNGPKSVSEPVLVDTEGMSKWDRLEHESNELFRALTEAGKNLDERDNAERMAYFRTATSLLDRIVGIQERALNLRKLAQFQQLVLSVMDDVLDGDQRVQVRARLEEAARGE